jgi:hypothetical protein
LDALLTALRQPEREAASAANRPPTPADAELAPLMRAARELATLRTAAPDLDFARDLRQRMLARASARRVEGIAPSAPAIHATRPTPLRSRAPFWAGIAAAALLAVSAGAFTVAAHAGPASPLFGLHRLEQGIQVAATNDSASRARLHIEYARQWLAALRQAASQHEGSDAFQSALAAMLEEDAAAQGDAAQVTDGATRADLWRALDALQGDERAGLHAALGQVRWADRVSATSALGQLGETIPGVTQVRVSTQQDGLHVTIAGSGFEQGAQLAINGQPAGQVVSVTPTQLVVVLVRGHYPEEVRSVGVSNPDGTAAQAPDNALGNLFPPGRDATESSRDDKGQVTPGTGDHSYGGTPTPTPGGHPVGGGGSGTPTPQVTPSVDH